jgi:threonine aldolase
MPMHLDGARLFNALVKTETNPNLMGSFFDSLSICFSKGLGAPVGSVLIGSNEFIHKARRVRKVLGGGMRQAGMLAAAGIYALENNVERLSVDHSNAQLIAKALEKCTWIEKVMNVETNIVIGYVKNDFTNTDFTKKLAENNILVIPFGKGKVRMVTHLDIQESHIEKVIKSLKF